MREEMIRIWNSHIQSRDIVYHLGDFDLKKDVVQIARRLNGSKYLVPGNHDRKAIKDPAFRREFAEVFPYSYAEISINRQMIVLSHFPYWEWNQIHRGAWHLHGHVHGKPTGIPGKILDVSADGNNLRPWSFERIEAYMSRRETRSHH